MKRSFPGNRRNRSLRLNSPEVFSPIRPIFFPTAAGTRRTEGANGPNGSGIENECSVWSGKRGPGFRSCQLSAISGQRADWMDSWGFGWRAVEMLSEFFLSRLKIHFSRE
jgi:hypothetical protein